ncbi:Acyl transferase domain-containing protein [Pedobacter steynii]|uniref:Acyl transferase domain-containing protein n=1 Tax=Pedobacter steynii TaxID=430522 RepID=A0A1G9ZFK8_9SPHI|nr:type I polyketide synthase [Pedobacter steynii]NQX40045.1 type I polyketide synthase [Pedobacter steynii]SDN19975.1 Acyl transferase domain-containing protein [Pedobacter steynii]
MKKTDVAIIGMSCIFPGAEDVAAFWQNIINKVDSTQTVPADRIDPVHFDSDATGVDRFYCNRGGFIPEFVFNPADFGILPLAVEGTEPDHLLTLSLVHKALGDAGVLEKDSILEKTGIIIGKGNYSGPGATRAIEIVRTGEQIVHLLKDLMPHLSGEEIEKVKKEYQLRKGRFGPDTAMGLIPNLVASLVANRLNLGGAAYSLDAACASSLLAIDHAVQELNSGRCDLVIAGGVHVGQNAAFWSIFSQLGALSKRGKISPFDANADGLLIGEGCGFVVLKRLDDAVRDQDKIYSVLKGVGVSSDGSGTSVMSPSVKGQLKAITQAWENSGLAAGKIGYIEAHGTGTPLGDKTEIETLSQFFGKDQSLPKAGIGTVKSNIGHAMPAAGIAGLIKASLALYHGIIPPTLHCDEPLALLKDSRFDAVQEAQDWEKSGLPRVAGVNAFGFGGINAHVVLEGYRPAEGQLNKAPEVKKAAVDQVLLLARESHDELILALENNDRNPGKGSYRIAVFDPSPERLKKALKIATKNLAWRNKQDIWYSNEPLLSKGGKIAFVFPGLDGLAGGEVNSVAEYFDIPQDQHTKAEGLLNEALKILNKSSVLDTALKQLGVLPEMNAGHSLGEWLAARSSELAEESSVLQLLSFLNPETFELKDSRFIAVGCGIEQLQPILKEIKHLYLSNDNCPQQVILCGSNTALEALVPILKARQIFHQILPFQSGFHSPFVADKLDVMLEGMSRMEFRKTKFPLWSATTLELYPEGFEAIRRLSVEHLIQPVRFRELTEKLYEEGARMFIQVGSGGLIGFIDDTLKGKNCSTVSSNTALRSGLTQLQRVLAALFVEGKEAGMKFMGYDQQQPLLKKGLKLQLGLPLISNMTGLKSLALQQQNKAPRREAIMEDIAHPLMKAFNENVEEMMGIQSELFQLFQNKSFTLNAYAPKSGTSPAAPPLVVTPVRMPFTKAIDITLENCPYLVDHSLLRQPKGWHCVDDMDPVIPMTMIFEMFGEIAAEQAPAERVHKILNIKVFQWMNVAKPFRETITGEWRAEHLVYLNLERFANAEVLLNREPATPAGRNFDIGESLNIDRTATQIYEEHMFHGPGYQGIRKLTKVGEKGITGIIEGGSGKGSLLDNAGQLFGLWLQLTLTKDRIAFPVKIQEIEFFGEMMDQEGTFECTCLLTELNDEFATADFVMKRDNQVWAIVTGWQNRRLEIDEALWKVSMSPLHNRLSEEVAPGVFLFHNAYTRVVSWDFILKRYFNQEEKKHHLSLLPNKRKEWIISRVAVKDAVRNLLNQQKNAACYPISFEVRSDEVHKPYLQGPMTDGISISIAHKGTDAVGIARFDRAVGIDIEKIEERSEGFYELVFSVAEQVLLAGKDKAEWATRFWVAKEAYGKFLGKGLQGNPRAYVIEEIMGEELRINNIIIRTIKHKNYIIGWTL